MRILMIAINDPAGTAIEFTKAINRYTPHRCRLITKEIRYNFMFAKDLHLPWLDADGLEEVQALLRNSDVFHFHMTADEFIELGPFRPADYLRGKIVVHHHHGHPDFRGNPEKYRRKYKERGRRRILVSTPDLLKLLPEANWQPNLVPLDETLYQPLDVDDSGLLRICQAPTRKELKNSAEFIKVTQKLSRHYPEIETVCIEGTKHAECLRIKQTCHIHFDHMQGYFGVSSLESLSQGKPVIAGLDDWNIRHIKAFTGADELPWRIARSADELENELCALIDEPAVRVEAGKASRGFMEENWTPRQVTALLMKVYQMS